MSNGCHGQFGLHGTRFHEGDVPLRTARAARRHSRPDLAAKVYTDPKLLDVAPAFDALPSFKEEVYRYEWDCRDDGTGVIARPEHNFAQPGEYTISLRIHPDKKTVHERKIRIHVPADYSLADSE